MYVRDETALEDLVGNLEGADVLAFDTEFMREKTYYAQPCLLQVASADLSAVVDLIEIKRVEPLLRLLTESSAVKVVHAGSQDIEILYQLSGRTPSPVFDTQIAATVAGFPSQVGYGQLVRDVLGVDLGKGDTFTNWAARPLTATQIAYAEDDVRHLPEIYARLRQQLSDAGRLGWLVEDFERLADPVTYEPDPRVQYRRVKRASSLDARGLAVLREVAAWRELEARRRDVPRRWLIGDESLVEIARRAPVDSAGLAAVRGVPDRLVARSGSAVLAAIAAGREVPEADLPRLPKRKRVPGDVQPIADLLSAVMRIRAKEHGVAPTLIATRDELERFAAGDRGEHPLASGWRHVMVGAELEAIVEGRLSVQVVEGRISLIELNQGPV